MSKFCSTFATGAGAHPHDLGTSSGPGVQELEEGDKIVWEETRAEQ